MRLNYFYLLQAILVIFLLTGNIQCSGIQPFQPLLQNSDEVQTFQCTSAQEECQLKYIPDSSFTGTVEVNFLTQQESYLSTYQQKLSALFCLNESTHCDFNGQYLGLRNLSIETQFVKDQEYTFSFKPQININEIIITHYIINKGNSCINNNCGGNGSCIISNNKKQCSCDNSFGGKNCEANVISARPNQQQNVSILPSTYKIIQYTFSASAKNVFENQQLDLIFSSAQTQQILNIYILDGQSQKSNGGYKQEYKQKAANTINLNKLFTNTSNTNNFILLIMLFNESPSSQSILVQLNTQDIAASDSSSDSYFIYFLIGMVGLIALIIISGFVYFYLKRRLIRECAQNNINMLAQNLLQQPLDTKDTETQEKYQKMFEEALPSLKMLASTLKQIIAQNNVQINEKSNDNNKNQNESDDAQNNNKECTCSICLQPIQEGEKYRETICKHIFHVECIDVWIQKQRNCPMCRTSHKLIDLRQHLKKLKRLSSTEIHQINGKVFQFEMVDNSVTSNGSSPLGFTPILPFSITRQQQQQTSPTQDNSQKGFSSPIKEQFSPMKSQRNLQLTPQAFFGLSSPQKTPSNRQHISMLQLNHAANDSSQMQITIPDNTHDLTNLQLPQTSLNESSIAGIITNNINNSCAFKKNNDDQDNTLTKIVDIMDNNNENKSSVIGYLSNGNNKIKQKYPQNQQTSLNSIIEEDNSIQNSNIRTQSQYNIFTDQALAISESDLEKGQQKGTLNSIQNELTTQIIESSKQQRRSTIKLSYNFDQQQKVQAQFLRQQIFTPSNKQRNSFIMKQ